MNNPKTLSLLPKMDNLNGSINKFHYLLIERGFSVDADLHGLRKLHLLTSKFAHSAENLSKNLISVLKTEGLFELYSKENWSELHREILNKYKKSLEMLLASISS